MENKNLSIEELDKLIQGSKELMGIKEDIDYNLPKTRRGRGLREQLKDVNIKPYTHLTYKVLEEFIQDLDKKAKKKGFTSSLNF